LQDEPLFRQVVDNQDLDVLSFKVHLQRRLERASVNTGNGAIAG
jgi:hypothetical protein